MTSISANHHGQKVFRDPCWDSSRGPFWQCHGLGYAPWQLLRHVALRVRGGHGLGGSDALPSRFLLLVLFSVCTAAWDGDAR